VKPTDAERDLAFDRLIARGLETETDAAGNACPDADLLAAWFDRSLSAAETERIETHAAGCASCQQILADLARSEPPVVRAAPVPEPAKPWHWHWRWVVPVATAAVVVVLATRPLRAPAPVVLRSDSPSVSGPALVATEQAVPLAAQAKEAPDAPPTEMVADRKPKASAAKDAGNLARRAERPEPSAPPAALVLVAPGTSDVVLERKGETTQSKVAGGLQQPSNAPGLGGVVGGALPKPAAADTAGRAEESVAVATPANVAPAPATGALRPAGMMAESRATPLPAVAFSPGAKSGWRVGGSGSIDRSLDGGRTWRPQATGVAGAVAAVSAYGATGCWAVGAEGVVLRTTDGSAWERVSAPARLNLVSVRASSADAATVTAADGSEFTTTDGGKNWKQVR
jgi:hypothetical protein